MGLINKELTNLKESDMWSFILFALFKLHESPEYSSISELSYVLDKPNMLRLCEYFGGLTLKIPTIDELEILIYSLQLYEYVNLEHLEFEAALKKLNPHNKNIRKIRTQYLTISQLLENYSFSSRGTV